MSQTNYIYEFVLLYLQYPYHHQIVHEVLNTIIPLLTLYGHFTNCIILTNSLILKINVELNNNLIFHYNMM